MNSQDEMDVNRINELLKQGQLVIMRLEDQQNQERGKLQDLLNQINTAQVQYQYDGQLKKQGIRPYQEEKMVQQDNIKPSEHVEQEIKIDKLAGKVKKTPQFEVLQRLNTVYTKTYITTEQIHNEVLLKIQEQKMLSQIKNMVQGFIIQKSRNVFKMAQQWVLPYQNKENVSNMNSNIKTKANLFKQYTKEVFSIFENTKKQMQKYIQQIKQIIKSTQQQRKLLQITIFSVKHLGKIKRQTKLIELGFIDNSQLQNNAQNTFQQLNKSFSDQLVKIALPFQYIKLESEQIRQRISELINFYRLSTENEQIQIMKTNMVLLHEVEEISFRCCKKMCVMKNLENKINLLSLQLKLQLQLYNYLPKLAQNFDSLYQYTLPMICKTIRQMEMDGFGILVE